MLAQCHLGSFAQATGGAQESPYTSEHYVAFPNLPDWDGRIFGNKAEQAMAKLWVSSLNTLLNTSYSLDILEIMTETSRLYAGFLHMPRGI